MHLVSTIGLLLGLTPTQTGTPQTGAPAAQQLPFTSPVVIADAKRLALTPKLDGKIDPEEWDSLAVNGDTTSFFQWEPGALHFAAKTTPGNDVILSIDVKANGWLIGADNIEVRVSENGGKPTAKARILDGSAATGPVWKDAPWISMATQVAVGSDGKNTIYEVSVLDPLNPNFEFKIGAKVAVRVDGIPATTPPLDPFYPRAMGIVELTTSRTAGLPGGLSCGVEGAGGFVQPGGPFKMRFTFRGTEKTVVKKISMRAEGYAQDLMSQVTTPFPAFDGRGRTYVDYTTQVAQSASRGYRVVRATLSDKDDTSSVVQASFRIPEIIEVIFPREVVKAQPTTFIRRFTYSLANNSNKRLDGTVSVTPPDFARIVNGGDSGFIIYNAFSRVKREVRLEIPANKTGTYPIKFRVLLGEKVFEFTEFITIR